MLKNYPLLVILGFVIGTRALAQDVSAGKPTEHVIGTVTRADAAAHTITIKDDKTGSETTILLADTKTLLKVPPGAKDLKTATRITADQLATGDRVDVRGSKPATDPEKIAARSVVLMSGRELQQVHQAQAAEWKDATAGVVTTVDAAGQKITMKQRTPGAPPLMVAVTPQTDFTRYSPDSPNTPVASSFGQIQAGDQVRVIGEAAQDGSATPDNLTAKRIYSGAFRTLTGTVISIGSDGKELVVKDLASNKPVTVLMNEDSKVRKIPPEVAARLAQRAAGGSGGASGASGGSGPAGSDIGRPGMGGPGAGGSGAGGPGASARPRDMSRMIERLPQISLSDLKAGDAVVVAGALKGADGSQLVATNVIAGVEPVLRSVPAGQQRGQSLGGDWGLGEIAVPQQ